MSRLFLSSIAMLVVQVASASAPASAAFVSQLYPPAPFPIVTGQAIITTIMTNGVSYAHHTLLTSAGPLSVNAILADAREPSSQFRTILAGDHLVSVGETTSSMAR